MDFDAPEALHAGTTVRRSFAPEALHSGVVPSIMGSAARMLSPNAFARRHKPAAKPANSANDISAEGAVASLWALRP